MTAPHFRRQRLGSFAPRLGWSPMGSAMHQVHYHHRYYGLLAPNWPLWAGATTMEQSTWSDQLPVGEYWPPTPCAANRVHNFFYFTMTLAPNLADVR